MRIIVFSHVRLFCEALSGYIGNDDRVSHVEPCFSAESLADSIRRGRPDIVLFDITSRRALDEARRIFDSCPRARIFALALPDIAERVIQCADAGFIGYFPRKAPLEDLLPALMRAARNECEMNPRITARLMQEIRRRHRYGAADADGDNKALTRREMDVMALVEAGSCNKEIAKKLGLSVATVKNHLHNIFVKLHVGSRSEALARYRDQPRQVHSG